jgi:hypothetical protein
LEYLVILRNPTSGATKKVRVDAPSTGQALAKLGKVPDGFGIDAVNAAQNIETSDDELSIPEYQEPSSEPETPQENAIPESVLQSQESEPVQYRAMIPGHSTSVVVFTWIFGALIGASSFWVPQFLSQRNDSSAAHSANSLLANDSTNTVPNQLASNSATNQPAQAIPAPTQSPRRSALSGTVWGLDQGETVPLAIYRVTGQDPQTRFLYEALVAADNENQARERYGQWSTYQVVKVARVAWLRGSPDDQEP